MANEDIRESESGVDVEIHKVDQDFKSGVLIGDYCIVGEAIAKGGCGTVYAALHQSQEGGCAILKVLEPSTTEMRLRFLRESGILARLQHPAVPRLLGRRVYEFRSGQLAMLITHKPGLTLQRHMRLNGTAAIEAAADVGCDVLDVLREAHARGIVHRDIKPGNVLVTPAGYASVIDFGISRERARTDLGEDALTQLNLTVGPMGTPCSMAPEQVHQKTPITVAADLYAVGTLLYFMLGGCHANGGQTEVEAIVNAATGAIERDVSKKRRDVPPALSAAIAQMLALEPKDRPASAEHAYRMIAPFSSRHGGLPKRPSTPGGAIGGGTPRPRGAVAEAPAEVATGSAAPETPVGALARDLEPPPPTARGFDGTRRPKRGIAVALFASVAVATQVVCVAGLLLATRALVTWSLAAERTSGAPPVAAALVGGADASTPSAVLDATAEASAPIEADAGAQPVDAARHDRPRRGETGHVSSREVSACDFRSASFSGVIRELQRLARPCNRTDVACVVEVVVSLEGSAGELIAVKNPRATSGEGDPFVEACVRQRTDARVRAPAGAPCVGSRRVPLQLLPVASR